MKLSFTDQSDCLKLLEQLSKSQNSAARAVKAGDLGRAHINLKATTIKIFENAGSDKIFDLQIALQLFLTFFRAAFYLENKAGDYAYRYQAIPGQLGNACYFQLRLATKDASDYTPAPEAVLECACAAHKLLAKYATTIIVQSHRERSQQVGIAYSPQDVIFAYNAVDYPIVKITNPSLGQKLDFSQPRFFDFMSFKKAVIANSPKDQNTFLNAVETHMKDSL